jgi:hypothetical protein
MQPVKRSSSGAQYIFLAFLGLIFTLASCGGLAIASPVFIQGNFSPAALLSAGNIGALIGGGIFTLAFLAVGLVMLGYGVRGLLARARVTRPEVALSTQTPRVGEGVTLTYRQTFRAGTDVQGIRFQLILRERATYRRGTDTVTVQHDNIVQEYQLPGRRFDAGQGFQDQRQFQVQGMHTFLASNNKLQWLIHVQVEMAGWPAYTEEYPLQVPPEFVR